MEDPASTNIKNSLLRHTRWKELNMSMFNGNPVYQHLDMNDVVMITINDKMIQHEDLDKEVEEQLGIKPKQMIFVSRHKGKSGEPTLSVHPIGNYGDAQFGGKPKTLVKSSPCMMTQLLRYIKTNVKKMGLYHKVCFEVTHHGPYIDVPAFFAEVGSTEREWSKKEGAEAVAWSIIMLLKSYHYENDFPRDIIVLIGIGGGHYAPRFTDIVFEKNVAFGHMIPSYHIEDGNVDIEILKKTLQATPNVSGVYFSRKALKKSQLSEYKEWIKNMGVPVFSSRELPSLF